MTTAKNSADVTKNTTTKTTTRKSVKKPETMAEAQEIKQIDITETQDLSIDLYGGKTTFFPESVEICKDVSTALTTEQAIKIAGLDWPVLESDIFSPIAYRDDNGDLQERFEVIPGYKKVYRKGLNGKDIIFQLSQNTWTPVQNTTSFEFFDPILADGKAKLDTAVMLEDGKKIVITAKITGLSSDIGKNDQVDSYIVLHNGHDGKLSLGVMFTPVRVICQNTLYYAIGNVKKGKRNKASDGDMFNDNYIRLKHTQNIDRNLEIISSAIDLNARNFRLASESYKTMAKTEINMDQYKEYLEVVFNSEVRQNTSIVDYKHYGSLVNYYQNGVGSDLSSGTLWQAYQSVTEFLSHKFGVKQNEDLNTPEATATRLNNLLFGKGASLNKAAFSEAQRLTTVM